MTKYERVKVWTRRNQDKIAGVVIVTAFVGIMIAAIKTYMVYKERQEIELNGYIDQLNALHSLD